MTFGFKEIEIKSLWQRLKVLTKGMQKAKDNMKPGGEKLQLTK